MVPGVAIRPLNLISYFSGNYSHTRTPRLRLPYDEQAKMAEETDALRLLDVQQVSDQARQEFSDMLGEVEGSKDIVIQPELMSLLNHVTPPTFLRR